MIRTLKRFLKKCLRLFTPGARTALRPGDEINLLLNSLVREITRVHTRIEMLEEVIQEALVGNGVPGGAKQRPLSLVQNTLSDFET